MENASKALIIAGSILISILIIGVGVMIFSNVNDMFSTDAVDEQAVAAYNDPFTRYQGDKKSGAQVRALCDAIKNHNLAATDESKKIVLVEGKAEDLAASEVTKTASSDSKAKDASHIAKIKNNILSGYTYTVTCGYDSKTGYVTQVGIQNN